MSTYPGSADNGAVDMEYTPEGKTSALDNKLAGIDEAIGVLQYALEQHIAASSAEVQAVADTLCADVDALNERLADAIQRVRNLERTVDWLDGLTTELAMADGEKRGRPTDHEISQRADIERLASQLEAAERLRAWAADAYIYIDAACAAMCAEMDAQPPKDTFAGPLYKALSSAGGIGIRGLLEYYEYLVGEDGDLERAADPESVEQWVAQRDGWAEMCKRIDSLDDRVAGLEIEADGRELNELRAFKADADARYARHDEIHGIALQGLHDDKRELLAERARLRAKWASVPWYAIEHLLYHVEPDNGNRIEVESWIAGKSPKEAAK